MTRAIVVTLTWIALAATAGGQEGGFPHRRHGGLFDGCESCHAGIASGDTASSMPGIKVCEECHDRTELPAAGVRRASSAPGLLRFSHPSHAAGVDSAGRACVTCHSDPGAAEMNVRRAAPSNCLGCHTHQAASHLAGDNRCATCHVPLTAAVRLSAERVAQLPKPPSHDRADFGAAHAPGAGPSAASCAVCHARETCARCHVNASQQPLVASLARDARVAGLVAGRPPSYPVPADHGAGDFGASHGGAATADAGRCGACHARASCATCHLGSGGAAVLRQLPLPDRGGASGVTLALRPSPTRDFGVSRSRGTARADADTRLVEVHDIGFRTGHGPRAATAPESCAGCHEQRFCSDCHAGEGQRRFHPPNFVQRHAPDAYGRETECASCHNAEAFCRACHRESGLGGAGRNAGTYHTAQPLWLLQHGAAARQGLQSCTTCHVQRDCLACHSTIGWGVSPHGPGFRAERLADRNATQCLLCHLRVPK